MASCFASLPSLAIKSRSIIVMQIVLMDFHLKIAHVYDFSLSFFLAFGQKVQVAWAVARIYE